MDKTAYMQLVRDRVRRTVKDELLRSMAIMLCDQYTSITEAEGSDRWTFFPQILERAYEARTGYLPPDQGATAEVAEKVLAGNDYPAARDALGVALKRIFSSPKPQGM